MFLIRQTISCMTSIALEDFRLLEPTYFRAPIRLSSNLVHRSHSSPRPLPAMAVEAWSRTHRDTVLLNDDVRAAWVRVLGAVDEQQEKTAEVLQLHAWLRLHRGRLSVLLAVSGSWTQPMPEIFRAWMIEFLLNEQPTMPPLPEIPPVHLPFPVRPLV